MASSLMSAPVGSSSSAAVRRAARAPGELMIEPDWLESAESAKHVEYNPGMGQAGAYGSEGVRGEDKRDGGEFFSMIFAHW